MPGTAQITYDYHGGTQRLKTVAKDPPSSSPSVYTYNSAGQRAIKFAANDVIYHFDLSGQLIAETTATGTAIKSYIWLHGQPLAMIDHQTGSCPADIDHDGTVDGADLAALAARFGTSCSGCGADIDMDGQVNTSDLALLAARLGSAACPGGTIFYYHNDHLGTPQKVTDTSGAVVWAADYLPFGQADVTMATVENNLRFAGQYYDSETGLHYNYHRYYDPQLGRYLRADPIGLTAGVNLYSYVLNNPLRLVDPSGNEQMLSNSDLWFNFSPPNDGANWGFSFYNVFGMDFSERWIDCCENGKKVKYNVVTICGGIGFAFEGNSPFSVPSNGASSGSCGSITCADLSEKWTFRKSHYLYFGLGVSSDLNLNNFNGSISPGLGLGVETVIIKFCNEKVFQKKETNDCCG